MMKVTNWALSLFAFIAALIMAVSVIAPLADNGAADDSVAAILSEESGSSVELGSGSGNGIAISYHYISKNDTKPADYASYIGYALLVDLVNPPQGQQVLSCELKDSEDRLVYKSPTSTPSNNKVLFPTAELDKGTYDVTISSNGLYSVSADLTVADDIAIYTIDVKAGAGGTVTSPNTVPEGGNAFIIVTPDEGYVIEKVTLDGMAISPSASENGSFLYVIENVRNNHSVEVTFISAGGKYLVTAVADSGGQISPSRAELAKGDIQTFTITPDAGYTLDDVKVNGVSVIQNVIDNGNGTFSYIYTHSVGRSESIITSFKPCESGETYTITASAGSGGKIEPSGNIPVNAGDSVSFKITPDSGYQVDGVTVDGKTVILDGDSYNFLGVTENHTISVTFKRTGGTPGPGPVGPSSGYTINASAGTGGSISPQGSVSVSSGSSKTFKITPDAGYAISTLLVDGKSVQISGDSYTFSNVTSNHTISVTFKKTGESETYIISASAGPGGKITPSGNISVAVGGSQTFTISADNGYEIDRVTVNGKETSVSNGSYTFSNVNADQSISVTFKEIGTEPTPSEGDDDNNTMYYILIAIVIIIILAVAAYLFMRSKH